MFIGTANIVAQHKTTQTRTWGLLCDNGRWDKFATKPINKAVYANGQIFFLMGGGYLPAHQLVAVA